MASRKLARAGAAAVGASMALLTAAIPASADPATGKVDGGEGGYNVDVGGNHDNISTSLIGFKLDDGTKLGMYCVEINTNIDREHAMTERPWDQYPVPDSPFHANRDKINWVLHYAYPVKSTDELSQLLTSNGATLNNGLDEKEAIAATQAAVWSFSDNTKLNKDNPLPKGPKDSAGDVVALYEYLTGADNVGIGEQPGPALQVNPTELTGVAGDRIGPFTVSTTGTVDEIKADLPEGVTVTDKDGNALDASGIANGTEIYLSTTQGTEGSASFELSASAGLDTGRLFVGNQYGQERDGKTKKTQSLIVAQAEKTTVTAAGSASWTATPTTTTTTPPAETTTQPPATTPSPENTGGLAETGASVFTPILIGAVLVAAGVGALLFQRKRRRV